MIMEALYARYCREFGDRLKEDLLTSAQFEAVFGTKLAQMDHVETDDPSQQGIIYYGVYEEAQRQVCVIPAYGWFASSEKVLTKLFTKLSGMLAARKTTLFQIHIYAHDLQAQRLFSLMQFGFMAETGILKPEIPQRNCEAACTIRTLTKPEIESAWDEIWCMTSAIIDHLRQAPVFYPGDEFTEDVYRAFFLDEDTQLHVAFDEAGRMIGMIETNTEPSAMIGGDARSVNIGEVYVAEELRGTGVSDALFSYALAFEKARGNRYLWVEHGTANPNARGFWGRYFKTHVYEMNRIIEYI